MNLLQRMACGHLETTEPDETGYAICTRCGAVLLVRLTREALDDAFKRLSRSVRRQGFRS